MTMPADWVPPEKSNSEISLGQEEEIWRNIVYSGFWNKKVAETQIITNQSVILNSNSIPLHELDDIITMDSHHEATGQGMRIRGTSGVSYGTGSSRGKSVGNVAFIYRGTPAIVFHNINDPASVVRLAKAARKRMITLIKAMEKERDKIKEEKEKPTLMETPEVKVELNPSSPLPLGSFDESTVDLSSRNYDNPHLEVVNEERIQASNKSRLESGEVTYDTPRCPKDGLIAFNGALFCSICGTKLVKRRLESLSVSKGKAGDLPATSYCPKDGTVHYGEFFKFCSACGCRLVTPSDTISNRTECSKCHGSNEVGSSFCNKCGFPLN